MALQTTRTEHLAMAQRTTQLIQKHDAYLSVQDCDSYLAEFCGYFPYSKPRYSMIVAIHKNEPPASGGAMEGSVFKAIAEYITASNR